MSEEMRPDEQISEEQLDDIAGGTIAAAQLSNLRNAVAARSNAALNRTTTSPAPTIFANGQPSAVNPNDPRNITITPVNTRGTPRGGGR